MHRHHIRGLLVAAAGGIATLAGGGLAIAAPIPTSPSDPATSESTVPACVVAADQPPATEPEVSPAATGSEVSPAATGSEVSPAATGSEVSPAATATSGSLSIPLPEGSGTGAEAAASSAPLDQVLVLGRDGLGVARFCDDAEATIATMTALAGPADDDTGWVDPITISSCPGTVARRVTWGALDLYFGDESSFASGVEHFFGYSYGNVDGFDVAPPGLSTPEGVGLGTPVEYLRATFPDVSLIPGEEGIQEPTFYVDEHLRGLLTDTADDGVVTLIIGGEACGV